MTPDITPSVKTENTLQAEFIRIKTLWNSTFGKDYEIVNHPDTPVNDFFRHPNNPDAHGRQYNLTLFPEDMTTDQFIANLRNTDTILVNCMDKDAVGPAYDKLISEKGNNGKGIFLLSMAGGIIQFDPDIPGQPNRKNALRDMLKFTSRTARVNGIKFGRIILTDHNHTCGYIKAKGLGGMALAEVLGTQPSSPAENSAMKSLIKFYAGGIQDLFPGTHVDLQLEEIDRNGSVVFTSVPDGNYAKPIDAFKK